METKAVRKRSQASEPAKNTFNIECEICFRALSATVKSRQPHVGSCGHSFCRRCALQVYGNCGLCRAQFIPVKNYSLIKHLEKIDEVKKKLLQKKKNLKGTGISVDELTEEDEDEDEEEVEDRVDEVQLDERGNLSLKKLRLFSPQLKPSEYLLMDPKVRQSLESKLDRLFTPYLKKGYPSLPAEFTNPLFRQAYEAHRRLLHIRAEVNLREEENFFSWLSNGILGNIRDGVSFVQRMLSSALQLVLEDDIANFEPESVSYNVEYAREAMARRIHRQQQRDREYRQEQHQQRRNRAPIISRQPHSRSSHQNRVQHQYQNASAHSRVTNYHQPRGSR